VQAASQDVEGERAWHLVHLVGDAMRSQELAGPCLNEEFVRAVQARIAVARFDTQALPPPAGAPAPLEVRGQVANDPANAWSWRMVAGMGAMSLALVAAFSLGGYWPSNGPAGTLAQSAKPVEAPVPPAKTPTLPVATPAPAQASATAAAPPAVMLRDPRLDELLAAHRQMGGTSALQKPAGFFRNAAHQEQASR
jgi:sigma-E factor negative regulatory protein RseA